MKMGREKAVLNIFFGHTHEIPTVFSGPVHNFLSHFTSSRAGYANDGAWAVRTKLDNYLPWPGRKDITKESFGIEKGLNRDVDKPDIVPVIGDSLLITFEGTVRLLRGCAYAAGGDEFVKEYLDGAPETAGQPQAPGSGQFEYNENRSKGTENTFSRGTTSLPENQASVDFLRAEGYSEFTIGLFIGVKEFFKSFHPSYRKRHYPPGKAPAWYKDKRSIEVSMNWASTLVGTVLPFPGATFILNVLTHATYFALFKENPQVLPGTQAVGQEELSAVNVPAGLENKKQMNLFEALAYLKSVKNINAAAAENEGGATGVLKTGQVRAENNGNKSLNSALKIVFTFAFLFVAPITLYSMTGLGGSLSGLMSSPLVGLASLACGVARNFIYSQRNI